MENETKKKNWFRRHPIITGILALIIIFVVIGAAGSSKGTSSSSNSTASSSSPTPAAKPMIIDATSLVGEYDKNKLSAQDKYTGKVVQTSGYIKNISSDITGSYYISLNPSNDQYYFGTTIQCYFNDKSQLTSLANGQQATVQGTMQDMSLGIVEMKDCQIIK